MRKQTRDSGRHGNGQQQANDQQADAASGFAVILPAHQVQGFVRQGMGQAGFADGNGEGTEGGVGQGNGCAASQALVKRGNGGVQ